MRFSVDIKRFVPKLPGFDSSRRKFIRQSGETVVGAAVATGIPSWARQVPGWREGARTIEERGESTEKESPKPTAEYLLTHTRELFENVVYKLFSNPDFLQINGARDFITSFDQGTKNFQHALDTVPSDNVQLKDWLERSMEYRSHDESHESWHRTNLLAGYELLQDDLVSLLHTIETNSPYDEATYNFTLDGFPDYADMFATPRKLWTSLQLLSQVLSTNDQKKIGYILPQLTQFFIKTAYWFSPVREVSVSTSEGFVRDDKKGRELARKITVSSNKDNDVEKKIKDYWRMFLVEYNAGERNTGGRTDKSYFVFTRFFQYLEKIAPGMINISGGGPDFSLTDRAHFSGKKGTFLSSDFFDFMDFMEKMNGKFSHDSTNMAPFQVWAQESLDRWLGILMHEFGHPKDLIYPSIQDWVGTYLPDFITYAKQYADMYALVRESLQGSKKNGVQAMSGHAIELASIDMMGIGIDEMNDQRDIDYLLEELRQLQGIMTEFEKLRDSEELIAAAGDEGKYFFSRKIKSPFAIWEGLSGGQDGMIETQFGELIHRGIVVQDERTKKSKRVRLKTSSVISSKEIDTLSQVVMQLGSSAPDQRQTQHQSDAYSPTYLALEGCLKVKNMYSLAIYQFIDRLESKGLLKDRKYEQLRVWSNGLKQRVEWYFGHAMTGRMEYLPGYMTSFGSTPDQIKGTNLEYMRDYFDRAEAWSKRSTRVPKGVRVDQSPVSFFSKLRATAFDIEKERLRLWHVDSDSVPDMEKNEDDADPVRQFSIAMGDKLMQLASGDPNLYLMLGNHD